MVADAVAMAERLCQQVRRAAEIEDLAPFDAKVIIVIGEHPEGVTSLEIAADLGLGGDDGYRTYLRRAISNLRREDLIRGGDRPGVRTPIFLTPEGRDIRAALIDSILGNGTASTPEEPDAPDPED